MSTIRYTSAEGCSNRLERPGRFKPLKTVSGGLPCGVKLGVRLFAVLILLVSCRSLTRPLDPGLREPPGEDINGVFPDAVYIKTRTQTFNTYHYYIIREGLIWYKSIDANQEPAEWTLFEKTGLPHNRWKPGFSKPKKIVNIAADADELVALSDDGGFYRFCFDSIIGRKSDVWFDRQGWPVEGQLFFDERTAKNIAWTLGKRNTHVLYYEDPFGNQHHNGTMEIATIYVLLEDGQEICYADTGLPSDFSRNYLGPERGAFKAAALSASASTMFVMNDAGEMYTRIADFDIIGADPMFFKYTYIPYRSNLSGTNYFSNLTEWGLPPEDWRPQPPIPLSGKAALSRFITILQNGRGNGARELRVAGLDGEGNTGYWTKEIFDGGWEFKTAALYLPPGSLLPDRGETGLRLPTLDTRLRGYRWSGGEREGETVYEIPNFNILEGKCEFKITRRGETCTLTLHPVELWTFQKRDYLPGRNGPPKMFFVTLDMEDRALEGLSEEFTDYLKRNYGKNDKVLFQYTLAAKTRYVILRDKDDAASTLFLTDGTISDYFPEFQLTWYIEYADEINAFNSPALRVSGAGRETVGQKIALNEQLRNELKAKIKPLKNAKALAFGVSFFYLPLDYSVRLSPLRFIDVPKFRTITRFGEEIVTSNTAHIYTVADTQIWVYGRIMELLDLRIRALKELDKRLAREDSVSPPDWYSEDINDYWDIAGLPRRVRGVFLGPSLLSSREVPAVLSFTRREGELLGWHLTAGNSPTPTFFVDPKKSTETIVSRQGKTPRERALKLACTLYPNADTRTALEREVIDQSLMPFMQDEKAGIDVTINFDGEHFVIEEYPPSHSNRVIFRGVKE
ncbi:MAG: hypothetical protein LBQ46_02450 [Treponema sp.]|nr:hypothetical protein [Treponema sp.]